MTYTSRKFHELNPSEDEINKLNNFHKGLVVAALSGETYSELALNFNIAVGTVKSRLNRARKAIAKMRLLNG